MEKLKFELYKKLQKLEGVEKFLSMFSTLVAAGFAFYYSKRLIFYTRKIERKHLYDEIPVPQGAYRYFGHLPMLGDFASKTVTGWHEKYGPLINVKMGIQNWVFIGDPDWAHDVFVSQGVSTSGRTTLGHGDSLFGRNQKGIIFNDYDRDWKNARTATSRILSPNFINEFQDVLNSESVRNTNQLISQTSIHGGIDPFPFIKLSATNAMLKVIYGAPPLKSIHNPYYKKLNRIIEASQKFTLPLDNMQTVLPLFSFVDYIFGKGRKMKNFYYKDYLPVYSELVREAREHNGNSLVKIFDSIKSELDISNERVKNILGELFVGGTSSLSACIVWTYVLLCNYPDLQQKLIEEIDRFITKNSRLPEFSDRPELPYYAAFQKECLRFRSVSLMGIPHKANSDVIYKNYFIPKDTVLVSNLHTLHSSKSHYYEPDKFIPERFLDKIETMYAASNGNANCRDQYAFGWGQRICPGIVLAEYELFYNVTRLLTRCTVEPIKSITGENIYPDLNVFKNSKSIMLPANVKLQFIERENRLTV